VKVLLYWDALELEITTSISQKKKEEAAWWSIYTEAFNLKKDITLTHKCIKREKERYCEKKEIKREILKNNMNWKVLSVRREENQRRNSSHK